MGYVLAIDQGTTGSTAMIMDETTAIVGRGYQEFPQIYPKPGWVEHNPEEIWKSVLAAIAQAISDAAIDKSKIAAVGITNQRETSLLWQKDTGQPLGNAIVWQDRRTADICEKLRSDGKEAEITAKTGLVLDPYFSATKLGWMLENVSGAKKRA